MHQENIMDNDATTQAIMNIAMHAMLADGEIQGDEQEMLRQTAAAVGVDVAVVDSSAELPSLEDCVAALKTPADQRQALDFAFHVLISDDNLDPKEEAFLAKLYTMIKPGDTVGGNRLVEIARSFTEAESEWRELRSHI
jgi:tellurite resistance protein